MTVKEQMIKAQTLIKAMEYEEARIILEKINHPTAKKWLAKINEIAPKKPKRENPIASFLFAIFQFVFASLLAGIPLSLLSQEFERANQQARLFGGSGSMNSAQSIMMFVLFIILFGGGLIISRKLSQWLRAKLNI